VKVRRDRVQGYLDNTLVCEYIKTGKSIRARDSWQLPNVHALGFGQWFSDTTITKAEIVEVTGVGKEAQER
jgi:hypothetical protein